MTTISSVLSPGAKDAAIARREAPLVDAVERILVAGIAITSAALHEAASADDLTLGQWRALAITHASDRLRIGELALRLSISVPSASRFVRRLAERGLLETRRDEDDRRATLILLTSRGRAVFDAVTSRRRELIAQAVAGERLSTASQSSIARLADRLTAFA